MKGKEKDHNSAIKYHRGPKPSRSTKEGKEEAKWAGYLPPALIPWIRVSLLEYSLVGILWLTKPNGVNC
jgi:hypothetical protein